MTNNQRVLRTIALITLWLCPAFALALPQYSILTGNRCINCHVNIQGAGLRNDLGYYTTDGVGLIKPEWVGLQGLFSSTFESNQAFDKKLTYGFDFRLQSSRSLTTSNPKRRLFPMQMSAYAALQVTDWLLAEGQYNLGPLKYQGQQSWSASIAIQPTQEYPQLRIGFFQPSVGLRYDDHTMLVRSEPGQNLNPLIAPMYAEWGSELCYYNPIWLQINVGLFRSVNLSQSTFVDTSGTPTSLIQDKSNPSILARVALSPAFINHKLHTMLGASILYNRDLSMINAFVGVGWNDLVCLLGEYSLQGKRDRRQVRCLSSEARLRVLDAVSIYVRYEHGSEENAIQGQPLSLYSRNTTIGAEIFLLPLVELRPEYRILDSDAAYRARWTVQLHVFY